MRRGLNLKTATTHVVEGEAKLLRDAARVRGICAICPTETELEPPAEGTPSVPPSQLA